MQTLASLYKHSRHEGGIPAMLRDAILAFKSEGQMPEPTERIAWRKLDAKYRHKSMAWKAVFQELIDRQFKAQFTQEMTERMAAKKAVEETALWETLKTLQHLEEQGAVPQGTFDQAFAQSRLGEFMSNSAEAHLRKKN